MITTLSHNTEMMKTRERAQNYSHKNQPIYLIQKKLDIVNTDLGTVFDVYYSDTISTVEMFLTDFLQVLYGPLG